MTIQTLASRQVSHCEIARLLGITEGAVCYRIKRMEAGAFDVRPVHGDEEFQRSAYVIVVVLEGLLYRFANGLDTGEVNYRADRMVGEAPV